LHLRGVSWSLSPFKVQMNDTLVRRRTTYGRKISAPPIQWANAMIRRFRVKFYCR